MKANEPVSVAPFVDLVSEGHPKAEQHQEIMNKKMVERILLHIH